MVTRRPTQFRDRPVQSVMQRGESKFVQLSFEAGKGLVKHRAPLALTVVVLIGRVSLTVDEHTHVLESSEMLAVDPGVEHAIEAIERSTVLLVLTPDATVVEKPTSSAKQPLEHACAPDRRTRAYSSAPPGSIFDADVR